MLKNIIFDMGNVLLRYDPEFIAKNIFEDKNISEKIYKLVAYSPQWHLLDEGKITDEQAILQLSKKYSKYKNEICEYMKNWVNFLPKINKTHDIVKTLKKTDIICTCYLMHLCGFMNIIKTMMFLNFSIR